ncbi:MAG TPA: hypothetical protein VFV75_19350 [Candidatus Polarisedimenticolaceae bacterium]|nr:hypothetical protein [Candidatus Polarisedimenticolaceae bacterium]
MRALLALLLAADAWFVSVPPLSVPPVPRAETHRLLEGGVVETDGFAQMTFSFGGEFKDGVPGSGRIGALLVPDDPKILHLLRTEGQVVFAVEVLYKVVPGQHAIFVSEQQTQRVAFPRYRVFFYNETGSTATVSLSVYRTRC